MIFHQSMVPALLFTYRTDLLISSLLGLQSRAFQELTGVQDEKSK